jgi:hypothetical protein
MSAEVLERTYGHHHPDYMRAAAAAITTKQPANVSGQRANVSLVEPENDRHKRQKAKENMVGPGGLQLWRRFRVLGGPTFAN